ncbi:MAG TPA: hypothetical protein VF041_11670 [Gemmatimonadaceae bacterium]
MPTGRDIVSLEDTLRRERVLSVYVDGCTSDPAARARWRTELEMAVDDVRRSLRDATHEERSAFEDAARALAERLATVRGAIGTPGWVAFATADGIQYAADLPVSVPLRVEWGTGITFAPALHALRENRPAIVAIVDARSARLYRYRDAQVEKVETLRAHAHIEPPLHMGAPPRGGFHTGTRGRTGTDAAERELRTGRARLVRDVAARIARVSEPDGWILLGGTPVARSEALAALPERVSRRARIVPELHSRATLAEITDAAAAAITALRRGEELADVRAVFDRAASNGHGALGFARTRAALAAGAVQRVFLTQRFLEQHPAEAEALVRSGLDERASVEIVSGEGAELLDARAGGIGAALRFAPSGRGEAARGTPVNAS